MGTPGSTARWIQRLEKPRGLESAWKGVTEGGNSMAKAQGCMLGTEEGLRKESHQVVPLAPPYFACDGQFTANPAVVSVMGVGTCPARF